VNPADQPILYLALDSPTMKLSDVDEAAETTLAQRISMVNGVAQVQVYGSQKYAVRVQLDPSELATRQIGIDEVGAALQSGNSNTPTGTLWGANHTFTILSNGQLRNATQFRPMIVAYRNGAPVRLEQLGMVTDSVQDNRTASWFDGNRAIVLAILRQPGTNTVEVVDSVKKLLPQLEQQIPAAVQVHILHDRSDTIRASVNDVKFTLLLTIALVVNRLGLAVGQARWWTILFGHSHHRHMYDAETLRQLLTNLGYRNIRQTKCGDSQLESLAELDIKGREAESFYLEASK
jgi:HAE1 family hydrophobic/amphiphilic exporter-1